MRVWNWSILAVVLLAAGCGRGPDAADYEGRESRLLVDVLQSLGGENPERSIEALRNLQEAAPNSRLPDLGIAHEQDRELVVRLNRHLRSGQLDEAAKILRHQQRFGDMGTSLLEWVDLPEALRALEKFLARKPYPNSFAARQALAEVEAFRPLLDRSAIFQDFLAAERQELEAVGQAEKERIARSLIADLDYLVLTGDSRADALFAQLEATVGENHPLPATVRAVARGDWRAVRELSEAAESGLYQSEYLEIAFARFWNDLSPEVRQALGRGLLRLPPCTLSGLLLHARYAAYYGRMEVAVGHVRELNSLVQLPPDLVGSMLQDLVQPAAAFATPAWKTPCPGVNDLLDRIDQLRKNGTVSGVKP